MANMRNESPCRIIDSYRMGRRRKARNSFAFGLEPPGRAYLFASGCVGRFTSGDDRLADVEQQAGIDGRIPKLTSIVSIPSQYWNIF